MKKSFRIAIVIALLSVLWIGSGVLMPSGDGKSDLSGETVSEKPVVQVRVRDLIAEDVANDIVLTGRTQASRKVALQAEIVGQVIEILAMEGLHVDKGSAILKLEERDRKTKVTEAKERLKQREIENNAAISLENKGFNSRIRLAQSKADLETARTELKLATVDLDKTEIKAPFAGIVYNQAVEVGDYIAVGETVFDIVDLDPIEMVGFVTERQVDEVIVGGGAKAVLVNDYETKGIVSYVSPAADAATRTFKIKISIPNADMKIIEGMTAEIYIPMRARKAHKISPSILSLNDEGSIGVKTVNSDNVVEFVPVSILADEPEFMWIGGLPDKVRVITVGQEFVVIGQIVKPVIAQGDGLL